METVGPIQLPPQYESILARSRDLQFTMNSDVLTGDLLRTLASAKPGGRVLELGTGCGLGTCWLLDGMDREARLVTVDNDARVQAIARGELGHDPRLEFHHEDGGSFLSRCRDSFDLIYADAWPGKYSHLDEALDRLTAGGIYVIDDLLPQPNWPPNHDVNVAALVERLGALEGFQWTWLDWSTGLGLLVRKVRK